MDPPLIHESSFLAANPSSYSLSGIWPFAGSTSAAVPGAVLGLRIGGLGGPYDSSDQRAGSVEESTVTDLSGTRLGRKRKDLSSADDSGKISTSSTAADLNGSNGKRVKAQRCKKGNGCSKVEVEASSEAGGKSEPNSKAPEPPKDYIHVRVRRGQATDSHSLAERARRVKISERMKILQDLVPGCSQRQVELLSMKLEVINSRININPNSKAFIQKMRTLVPEQHGTPQIPEPGSCLWSTLWTDNTSVPRSAGLRALGPALISKGICRSASTQLASHGRKLWRTI